MLWLKVLIRRILGKNLEPDSWTRMAQKNRLLVRLASTMGWLAGFLAVSALCGVLAAGLVIPGVAAAGASVSGSISFFNSLPSDFAVETPSHSTKVLTSDGRPIATFYTENRVKVPLDQMSPFIKDAIVSIEDSRFYEHCGRGPPGHTAGAATYNLTTGRPTGSLHPDPAVRHQRDQ